MPISKQALPINFFQGLDKKTDPKQVQFGRFLALSNAIFDEGGLLQKRNGFGSLAPLPDLASSLCTSFKGNLLAVGTSLRAYSSSIGQWINKGGIQTVGLSALPLYRSSTNQSQADSAVAPNGLVCTVFTDSSPSAYKYIIADSVTGQTFSGPAVITATTAPRVFVLNNFFVIVFGGAGNLLSYISININTLAINAPVDLSTQYSQASTGNFDGVVANNNLYLAFNGTDGGGAIRMTYIDSTLTQHNTVVFASRVATHMSVTADTSNSTPVIWAGFYNSGSSTGYSLAVSASLLTLLAPTQWLASGTVKNVTSLATGAICTIFYEMDNAYGYDAGIKSNFVKSNTLTQAGTLGTAAVVARSIGLGSKAFYVAGSAYFLGAYSSTFQPSYFLMTGAGSVIGKLAYSNGGGYYVTGLPSVTVSASKAYISYLIKDLVTSVNKTQGIANAAGVYSQTGVNLASFDFAPSKYSSAELGNNLHVGGSIVWAYDGNNAVEQNFNLWPESIEATWSATGGSIAAKPDGSTNTSAYFYQVTYEWQDQQGNTHRSAPSVPLAVTTTGAGTTGSITVNVPTLRLTYKTNVRIMLYRWSVAQQSYYSIFTPAQILANDPTVDSVAYVDTLADASILGNALIYTTGGVVEDIGPPATLAMTVFQSRIVMIDSEDPYVLWFSKQVVESSPVEMSDLFTRYIAPSIISREPSGPPKTIVPMDDKLIIGRHASFCYMTGTGPDSTGLNNDFSEPVFITSAVGCDNQVSFVMIPDGLMFQAAGGKGIWLLGRDLSVNYIGAAVESYNSSAITSAVSIPETNQVRFTLQGTNTTLVYDYYWKQWGTFNNPEAVSSCLFQDLQTYIDTRGKVYQETPGLYLDGSSPVLLSFTTSWIKLAGLQGFQRFCEAALLGDWLSPHLLHVGFAYDYAPGSSQVETIRPDNYQPNWGGGALWGTDGTWGGSSLENWRMFPEQQKCTAFQITITESYDPQYGVPAGAGFNLSGLNLVLGVKKGWKPQSASHTAA